MLEVSKLPNCESIKRGIYCIDNAAGRTGTGESRLSTCARHIL